MPVEISRSCRAARVAGALIASLALASPAAIAAADEVESAPTAEIEPVAAKEIARLTGPAREQMQAALARHARFGSRVARVLHRCGAPGGADVLPFLLADYDPAANFPGDAAGLWRIDREEARRGGLRRDAFVDARRDPEDATLWACAELTRARDAAGGDAHAALVSFTRARLLRSESAAPDVAALSARLTAAWIVLADPKAHGFEAPAAASQAAVPLRALTDLSRLTLLADAPGGVVRDHNPELLTDYIPPDGGTYAVVVPAENEHALEAVNASANAVAPRDGLRGVRVLTIKKKRGTPLDILARRYDTSPASLRAWNGILEGREPKKGAKLIIYVRDDAASSDGDEGETGSTRAPWTVINQ
ncbi:hypothetical protein K8I61_05140 [bacterium]|nr:hypothetical protein [bacterium]